MSKQKSAARHAMTQPSSLARITTTVAVTGGLVATLGVTENAGAAPSTGSIHESRTAATTPLALKAVTPAKSLVVEAATAPKKAAPTAVSRSQVRRALTAAPAVDTHRQTRAAAPAAAPSEPRQDRAQAAQQAVGRQDRQHRRAEAAARAERRAAAQQPAAQRQVSRTQARRITTTRQAAPVTFAAPKQAPSTAGVVGIASGLTGIPYVYGGSTPAGFDCSGFVSYVFAQAGVQLPHQSGAIKAMTTPVSDPRPGDLVFLPGHVAIYAGDGMVYEARNPSALSGLYPVLPGSTYGRL